MKKINVLMLGIWLSVMAIALQSCDNNDDVHVNIQPTAVVTVKPNGDNSSFYMQVTDSTTLLPVNMKTSPFGNKEVRALVNFTPAGKASDHQGQTVTVNWIDSILTKQTARNFAEKNDSAYGNDPVEIVNSWETVAEDGYLTLRFRTRWMPGSTHNVTLVHRNDANTPYLLQFYHNANGDAYTGNIGDGLVAFRLNEAFDTPDEPIEITLQWNSYSGTKTTKFKYRPRKD